MTPKKRKLVCTPRRTNYTIPGSAKTTAFAGKGFARGAKHKTKQTQVQTPGPTDNTSSKSPQSTSMYHIQTQQQTYNDSSEEDEIDDDVYIIDKQGNSLNNFEAEEEEEESGEYNSSDNDSSNNDSSDNDNSDDDDNEEEETTGDGDYGDRSESEEETEIVVQTVQGGDNRNGDLFNNQSSSEEEEDVQVMQMPPPTEETLVVMMEGDDNSLSSSSSSHTKTPPPPPYPPPHTNDVLFGRCFRLDPNGQVTLAEIHATLENKAADFGIKYTLRLRGRDTKGEITTLRNWIKCLFADQMADGQVSEKQTRNGTTASPVQYQGFALIGDGATSPKKNTKKAALPKKSSSSSPTRKAKKSSSPPLAHPSSWYCSHCATHHTLTSASPHQPFTRKHGFSVMKVEADGDCFYNCIIECLDSDETYKEEMDDEFSRMAEKGGGDFFGNDGMRINDKLTVTFMRDIVASKVRREGEPPTRGVWTPFPFLPFPPPPHPFASPVVVVAPQTKSSRRRS